LNFIASAYFPTAFSPAFQPRKLAPPEASPFPTALAIPTILASFTFYNNYRKKYFIQILFRPAYVAPPAAPLAAHLPRNLAAAPIFHPPLQSKFKIIIILILLNINPFKTQKY
jgi:hypothetical protein